MHGEYLDARARSNTDYLRVYATTESMQITLVSLRPGEYIPAETHGGTQVVHVVDGDVDLYEFVNGAPVHSHASDASLIIPAGLKHEIHVRGARTAKLLMYYSFGRTPPHRPGQVIARMPYRGPVLRGVS